MFFSSIHSFAAPIKFFFLLSLFVASVVNLRVGRSAEPAVATKSLKQLLSKRIALIGGTVIDVQSRGQSTNDIPNAVVVIHNGVIESVSQKLNIPADAKVIDVSGKYITPGLIDAFAALNDQSYANAYLHEGVTSIIAVSGGRRGRLVRDANPCPTVYELESIGDEDISTPDALKQLETLHKKNIKIALLMYRLKPDQLKVLVARAKELGMGTIGELAETTYAQGAEIGLDAFVHTTRYSLDMADEAMRKAVGKQPFSDDLKSAKWQYYLWLTRLKPDNPRLKAHAAMLGKSKTAILPTAALLYLDHTFAQNPWKEPVAKIIAPGLVDAPANRLTGKHYYDSEHEKAYAAVAKAELLLEAAYYKAGAKYLAGSGTDVWGTMPGISLHHELFLLTKFGLSPREALAAATSNVAETFRWKNVGQVAPKFRADLLVLNEDPRKNVAALKKIDSVFLAGKKFSPKELLTVAPRTTKPNGTILSRSAFVTPKKYLDANGKPKKEYEFLNRVTLERIVYASDGLRITGYLATPNASEMSGGKIPAQKQYPGIIYNRGGNREFGVLSPRKVVNILGRMASWGYVVVGSQYRGTDGSDGMEEYGGSDVNDVLNLLPLLDMHPAADGKRIGMVGGSRGGLMTYAAIAKTKRIRAAVIRCGVSDLSDWTGDRPEMAEVFNDLIPDFDETKPMSLKSRSPVYWVDKLPKTTPILLLQGTADWRVSPKSALKMSEALLEKKHPFRLVMLEGSDHSLSEHREEARKLTRNWLDRFVRDKKPLPNTTPHGD